VTRIPPTGGFNRIGRLFERWQEGWLHLFLMGAGLGLSLLVPGLVAAPYYVVFDLLGEPSMLPHPFWAWGLAFVTTGPHWVTLATRAFWPPKA
jgi:hypothetical protein